VTHSPLIYRLNYDFLNVLLIYLDRKDRNMEKIVTLRLSDVDAGQIIDGLTERMKVWKATEKYLRTGLA